MFNLPCSNSNLLDVDASLCPTPVRKLAIKSHFASSGAKCSDWLVFIIIGIWDEMAWMDKTGHTLSNVASNLTHVSGTVFRSKSESGIKFDIGL